MSDSEEVHQAAPKKAKAVKRKAPTGKKEKKSKKTKGPKRALSAYMFFVKENRQKVIDKYPDLSFGEVGKKLGKLWAELTEDEKAPYVRLNKADKERYEREKANFESSGGGDDDEDEAPKKKKKVAPKKKAPPKKKKEESEEEDDDDGGDGNDSGDEDSD